jgi:hypothetical protein
MLAKSRVDLKSVERLVYEEHRVSLLGGPAEICNIDSPLKVMYVGSGRATF